MSKNTMTKLLELLERHAVPALVVIVSMYISIDGLKRDMVDLKESVKLIADQQLQITRIEGDINKHEWHIVDHESRIKDLEHTR